MARSWGALWAIRFDGDDALCYYLYWFLFFSVLFFLLHLVKRVKLDRYVSLALFFIYLY